MSYQKNLPGFGSAISSPESGDGHTRSDSQDGPTIGPCGPDRALASLSARQAEERGLMTKDTYGRRGDGCSTSADLQSSLESRLRRNLAGTGSPEYALTWKHWDMESGLPICALRASVRRTSGNGYGGWPTPQAGTPAQKGYNEAGNTDFSRKATEIVAGWATPNTTDSTGADTQGRQGGMNLQTAAVMGWSTPTAEDGRRGNKPPRPQDKGHPLSQQAVMAGYPTPTSKDHKDGEYCEKVPINALLGRQAWTIGSGAQMKKRGALNPALSRWLMGYPVAWDSCGATAMQSYRK